MGHFFKVDTAWLLLNKIPIVAAISLSQASHPIHPRITTVTGFRSEAIADWAKMHLAPAISLLSDGLACFRAVSTANGHGLLLHPLHGKGSERRGDLWVIN